jgi:hypothetical protein
VLPYFHRIKSGWNDYFCNIEKYILMKKTNIFYQLLIGMAICGFAYCGDGTTGNGATEFDSTNNGNDSANAAHHVDPANAYPQPPVTGSNQDSSRTKDSPRIKDTQNRTSH